MLYFIFQLNVEGQFCDTCRDGYFSLDLNNPDGCIPCYCSGVSEACQITYIENHVVSTNTFIIYSSILPDRFCSYFTDHNKYITFISVSNIIRMDSNGYECIKVSHPYSRY